MKRLHGLLLLGLLAVGLVVSGCGSGGGKITGSVKLDGKPLTDAEVQFTPAEDQALGANFAVTDSDGKFEVQRHPKTGLTLKPGKYHVFVTKWVKKRDGSLPSKEEAEDLRAAGMLRNVVPPKYAPNPEADRPPLLNVEIKGGDQELPPFDLKK
jgi:hypothetical protein